MNQAEFLDLLKSEGQVPDCVVELEPMPKDCFDVVCE